MASPGPRLAGVGVNSKACHKNAETTPEGRSGLSIFMRGARYADGSSHCFGGDHVKVTSGSRFEPLSGRGAPQLVGPDRPGVEVAGLAPWLAWRTRPGVEAGRPSRHGAADQASVGGDAGMRA